MFACAARMGHSSCSIMFTAVHGIDASVRYHTVRLRMNPPRPIRERPSIPSVLLSVGIILAFLAASPKPTYGGMGMDWGGGGGGGDPAPPGPIYLTRLDVGAHGPVRVAVDPQGRFYITDPERYRVIVTDAWGEATVALPVQAYPVGIAVGPDGRIYLGDALTHAVYVLDAQGRFLHALGGGQDEFYWPHDIAVHPISGWVYVADGPANQVKVYDSAGVKLINVTGPADAPLNFPTSVAIDPSGIYLVVSDNRNRRLQLFGIDIDSSSNTYGYVSWISNLGSPEEPLATRPVGLALDNMGQIYVADSFQSKVYVFDLEGASQGNAGQYGVLPGDLRIPTDSAMDPFGRLAVVSYNNGTLELYGPEGYTDPPAEVEPPTISSLELPGDEPPVVEASVSFSPNTLNLSSSGNWVRAYIEPADGSAAEIDVSTILLNGQGPAVRLRPGGQ
jgi:DNA-binding beta-propeller fold protein YncE